METKTLIIILIIICYAGVGYIIDMLLILLKLEKKSRLSSFGNLIFWPILLIIWIFLIDHENVEISQKSFEKK